MSIHRACCCGAADCDALPDIVGCFSCAVNRSDTFKICIQGETGDAAVLNSSGHTLTRVSEFLYRIESAASFKIELEFDGTEPPANDYEIRAYLWDGSAFALERTTSSSINSGDLVQTTIPATGVTYKVWVLEPTTPDTVEVTTDYFSDSSITCTDNRAYGSGVGRTWIIENPTGLNGTFELTRNTAIGECHYQAHQGTVDFEAAEAPPETLTGVPVLWTFNPISKELTARADFSGTIYPTMQCRIWEVTFAGVSRCTYGGGTYGPTGNTIGCSLGAFDASVGGTVNDAFDEISVEVPAA